MAPTDTQTDLQTRWAPADWQLAQAKGLMKPGDDCAIVAIALPGKEFGWWQLGQEVEHVAFVYVCHVDEDIREGRNMACAAAAAHLAGREGTCSYAYVNPNGTWSVFEDILAPESWADYVWPQDAEERALAITDGWVQ